MKRILLVDGTNVVMRFAHAMAAPFVSDPLNVAADRDVQRVMSAVIRAVRECARQAECQYAIVAADSSPSWRLDMYPEYKANRTVSTRAWSDRLGLECANQNVQFVRSPGYEADDVVATLAKRATDHDRPCAVLSGDSDLLMLASELCDVYQFGTKAEPRYVRRSPEWICEKYGIANPRQLRAYKAIVGEPGDNLPGIDGYGPVKARKLLARWGSGENLFQSVAFTAEQHARYALMLNLVWLRDDAPIGPINAAACRLEAA